MNSTLCRAACVSVLGFWSQVTVTAQPEVENATRAALRGMQASLQQVSVTPHHLSKTEVAGLRAVLAEARQHLARLAAAFDAGEAPIAYLEDLMAVSLRFSQLAMRSSFTCSELGTLRELEKDLRAKRLCAERNPATPGGTQTLEFAAKESAATANAMVVCVQKVTGVENQSSTVVRAASGARPSVTLVPGLYRMWRPPPESTGETAKHLELVVDGSQALVEVPGR